MPITQQAKKALRSSARKSVFNARVKRAYKSAVKEIRDLISSGKTKEAKEKMPLVQKMIDKAVKKGIIRKNTASRTKSRIVKAIKKSESK